MQIVYSLPSVPGSRAGMQDAAVGAAARARSLAARAHRAAIAKRGATVRLRKKTSLMSVVPRPIAPVVVARPIAPVVVASATSQARGEPHACGSPASYVLARVEEEVEQLKAQLRATRERAQHFEDSCSRLQLQHRGVQRGALQR